MSGARRSPRVNAIIVAAVCAAACATLSTVARLSAGESHPEPPAGRDVEYALGILDYVGGDYEGAVDAHGGIRHAAEYDEQQELLARAEALLERSTAGKHPELMAEVAALREACAARVSPAAFVLSERRLHARIVHELDVRLAPRLVPSIAVGRLVYAQACAVCHGNDGRARGEIAATLDPPARDFTAAEFTPHLSPYRAFSLVTFGIPKTAMPSFEALPEDERWSVAFYVLALRHPKPADSGTAAVAGAGAGTAAGAAAAGALTLRDLAFATDADLAARLHDRSQAARAKQVARWRWSLPIELGD